MIGGLDNLRELFLKTTEIPNDDLTTLFAQWNYEKSVCKGRYLIEKGRVESHLFFIHSGTFKIYYLNNGEEVCVGFGYPNTLISSHPSFIRGKPSEYSIEAITDGELTGISKKDFFETMEMLPSLQKCYLFLTEEALLGKIQRELEMLTFTPEQRYLSLLERSAHVFQLIPQKYLASYLGMTPETFSRIKRKVLLNK